nr:PP2C family serine/threonine-protein phosphatase [Methyloversatilis discipulorum]
MRRTALNGVRRVAPLNAAIASDVGAVRQENQDRVAVVRGSDLTGSPFILAALADGIGGMKNGSECAAIALGTFIDCIATEAQHNLDPLRWMERACTQANMAVWSKHSGEGGSTLVAILLTTLGQPIWLSVGDSRVYQANGGNLLQLSRDDTLEGQLGKPIEGGRRSELLQFVGIGEALEPHVEYFPLDTNGTILLTTDGVHFVEQEFLARVVFHAPDIGLCAKRLTEVAKMLGGPDNASVVAISVEALQVDSDAPLDSTLEVWDPFGELQVLFERGSRDSAYSAKTTISPTKAVAERDTAVNPATTPSKPTNKGKQPKKSKSSKKPRQKDDITDANEDNPSEKPQLVIEFPRKTS